VLFEQLWVGTALSADWMRPSRLYQYRAEYADLESTATLTTPNHLAVGTFVKLPCATRQAASAIGQPGSNSRPFGTPTRIGGPSWSRDRKKRPAKRAADRRCRLLGVYGPVDLSMVGVLAGLADDACGSRSQPLRPFPQLTRTTLLVSDDDAHRALDALKGTDNAVP
jgi:hypothetical protein